MNMMSISRGKSLPRKRKLTQAKLIEQRKISTEIDTIDPCGNSHHIESLINQLDM